MQGQPLRFFTHLRLLLCVSMPQALPGCPLHAHLLPAPSHCSQCSALFLPWPPPILLHSPCLDHLTTTRCLTLQRIPCSTSVLVNNSSALFFPSPNHVFSRLVPVLSRSDSACCASRSCSERSGKLEIILVLISTAWLYHLGAQPQNRRDLLPQRDPFLLWE